MSNQTNWKKNENQHLLVIIECFLFVVFFCAVLALRYMHLPFERRVQFHDKHRSKKGFFLYCGLWNTQIKCHSFFFSRLHVRQSSAEKKVKGDSMQSTMKLHNFLFNFTIQFIQIKLPVTVAITNAASVTATLKRNAHYIFSFRFSNLQFSQTSSM